MTRKLLFFACCIAVCSMVLIGCGESSGGESGTSQNVSSSVSGFAESDICSIDASSNEMPGNDFGVDAQTYFAETYGASDAENLELIDSAQFVWLAANKGHSVVVIADPNDKNSESMVLAAQKTANDLEAIAYVYEPSRDAQNPNDWASLAKDLANQGILNLTELKPGTLLVMSKLAADATGQLAPIQNTVDNADGVAEAMEDAFSLSCCG